MRSILRQIGPEHAILLSSHILSEVSAVCDRLLVLSNGTLVANASPEELRDQYGDKERYELVIAGDGEKCATILSAMPGVRQVELEPSKDGCTDMLRFSTSVEDAAAVAYTATRESEGILKSFGPSRQSLEEAFLFLTQDRRYEGEATQND